MRFGIVSWALCAAMVCPPLAAQPVPPLPHSFAADLCSAVYGQIRESDPTKGTHSTYQTQIYAASGVDAKADTPEIIRSKIQRFWQTHWRSLHCSNINFTVRNGNILKQAVEASSNNFLNDMIRKWQVDFNVVDPADNETVLDFVDRALSRAHAENNTNMVAVYRNKVNLLLKFGGKRARELN